MKSQFPNSAIRMEFSNSKPEDLARRFGHGVPTR